MWFSKDPLGNSKTVLGIKDILKVHILKYDIPDKTLEILLYFILHVGFNIGKAKIKVIRFEHLNRNQIMGAWKIIFGYLFQNDNKTLKHFLKINIESNMITKNLGHS